MKINADRFLSDLYTLPGFGAAGVGKRGDPARLFGGGVDAGLKTLAGAFERLAG